MAPDPEPPACRSSNEVDAWARFPGGECDWELHDEGERLRLSSLALSASAPARGEVPPPCRDRTCVYHGALTPVGPLVLAIVPSLDSEMPSDVLLGLAVGERLVFTSLWDGAGEPVQSDFTRVGPAHALAPFVCGEVLALLAVERIDAAGAVVPETLRAREGRIDPTAVGVVDAAGSTEADDSGDVADSADSADVADSADPWAPVGPVERGSCRAVDLPVP